MQDFNTPNMQMDMFPSQNENISVIFDKFDDINTLTHY